MLKLPLKVGKQYITKDGRVVEIKLNDGTAKYPFRAIDDKKSGPIWYTKEGLSAVSNLGVNALDIIGEVAPEVEKTDFDKLKELLESFNFPKDRIIISEQFEIDLYTETGDPIFFFFDGDTGKCRNIT